MTTSASPLPEPPARRWIAHLDMDAFFASVELLKYPELRGEAVVIGGGRLQQPVLQSDGTRQFARMRDYVGRGVVTTSTYAARKFGVFSAMGIMKAAKLAPPKLAAQLAELKHALHLNELFTAVLGHDLRTPLSVVMNARHWTLICCTAVCRACLPCRMIRIKRIICPLSTRSCM